jgi:hypothetical protein
MASVFDNREFKLVDDAAKGGGIWTMICVAFANVVMMPAYTSDLSSGLRWLLGLVIMGLFGMASTALGVWLKWHLDRHKRNTESSERD